MYLCSYRNTQKYISLLNEESKIHIVLKKVKILKMTTMKIEKN